MSTILDGYPQADGAKMESVIYKAGPSLYTVVTPGTTPTGGQAVTASEFGLKYLEHVEGGLDNTGTYLVFFTPKITGKGPVTSGILSGGISAWRGEVLKAIPFIPEEGFHMMEDMHFCRKVTQRFGSRLLINPKATLQHFPAQEGRALKGEFEEHRLQEAFAFYRYHKKGIFDLLSFLWLMLGHTVFSLGKSLLCQSSQPLRGHGRGVLICFMHWKKGG